MEQSGEQRIECFGQIAIECSENRAEGRAENRDGRAQKGESRWDAEKESENIVH
jgi:hypothetical protein